MNRVHASSPGILTAAHARAGSAQWRTRWTGYGAQPPLQEIGASHRIGTAGRGSQWRNHGGGHRSAGCAVPLAAGCRASATASRQTHPRFGPAIISPRCSGNRGAKFYLPEAGTIEPTCNMSKRPKAGDQGAARTGPATSAELYQRVWQINRNLQEARAWLRELVSEGTFARGQVRPYEELLEEAQAAINSFLLSEHRRCSINRRAHPITAVDLPRLGPGNDTRADASETARQIPHRSSQLEFFAPLPKPSRAYHLEKCIVIGKSNKTPLTVVPVMNAKRPYRRRRTSDKV
jgi:hypothetical protein